MQAASIDIQSEPTNAKSVSVPAFADGDADSIMDWALGRFREPTQLRLASSMGAEDVVLIDMLAERGERASGVTIFMLDTGRLHQETYDVVDRIRQRYGLEIAVYWPRSELLQSLLRSKGPNSFYDSIDDRRECCSVRKLEPLGRALDGADAWLTGLRRSQSVTRANAGPVELDAAHGNILKINPLIDWDHEKVWSYIKSNNVPYNALHDQGYPSIGCAPCTRAISENEDLRAGRWWWENPDQRECGLHNARRAKP